MLFLLACQAPLDFSKNPDSLSTQIIDSQQESLPIIPDDSQQESPQDSQDSADTALPPPADPDIIVDCNGNGDYTTITAAIVAAHSGQRIGLKPCTYNEDIDYIGKSLTIFGMESPEQTIIQGSGQGSVVTVAHGEMLGTSLERLTVRGGRQSRDYGSGLRASLAWIHVENVIFTGNNSGYAVIYGFGASTELVNVNLHDNTVDRGGGALVFDNGTVLLEGVQIECQNMDYGVYSHASTLILDSTLQCGDIYGVDVEGGEAHLRRSRIESNGTAIFGEDNPDTRNERMWLFNSALIGSTAAYARFMHVKVENSVFYGSQTGLDMEQAHIESYVYNSALLGNCGLKSDGYPYIFGWNFISDTCNAEAFGTLTGDPGFMNAPDNLHLRSNSPLIDAGSPDSSDKDADGSRNDIGLYGGPRSAFSEAAP